MANDLSDIGNAGYTSPPVTFVILGFNQETVIDQAIDGALAQNYENLQIVFSDDGSSDATFDIMTERAAAYRGPHRVCAIRTPRNAGLVHHLLNAITVADGDLIVVSAGDDVSLPDRVLTLVDHWQQHRPAVIYSAWNLMDFEGRFLYTDSSATTRIFDSAAYFPDRDVSVAFGCSAAYSRAFLQTVALPAQPIWAEDYFLSLLAMLADEAIEYIGTPLVSYRQNPQALRNFNAAGIDALAYEKREMRFFKQLAEHLGAFLDIVDAGHPPARTRISRDAIVRDIAWYRYRANWARYSLLGRLRYMVALRDGQRLRWALPRIIGAEPFVKLKTKLASVRRRAGAVG